MLHGLHGGTQVAPANVDIDPARQTGVFTAQHGRPVGDADVRHVRQHQSLAALGNDGQAAQFFQGVTDFARVTHIDRKALQSFHRLTDVFTTHSRRNNRLHVGNIQAKAGSVVAAYVDVHIAPAGQSFGQRAADARHVFERTFNLAGDAVNRCQVSAGNLDAYRALDACSQHVNAVAYGRHPDIGQPRHLDDTVEFINQFVGGHAGPPLVPRLELDGGLEHFHGRRVSSGFGTARLAKNAGHLGYRLDQPICLLQQFSRLAGRKAWQCGRHIQQVTFVQARHEFAANMLKRPKAEHQSHGSNDQCQLRRTQHDFQQGAIDSDEQAIERIALFIRDTAPDQVAHQYRNQGN